MNPTQADSNNMNPLIYFSIFTKKLFSQQFNCKAEIHLNSGGTTC